MNIFKQLFERKHQAAVASISTYHSSAPSWVKPDLEKVKDARSDAELFVLLSHRSGYVREAAVIRAGELLLPTILPHLMPRINDWVLEVRLAAHKSVEAYLNADKFNDVLYALPALYLLRSCGRADHAAFVEYIEQFLIKNPKASEIPKILTKRIGIHARSLFDLSWKYNLAPKSELIRAGLASKDLPTSRRSCLAVHQLPETEQLDFAVELLKMKSGWLRYDGLLIMSRFAGTRAQKEAELNLLAEYAPLRELAERLSGWSKQQLASLRRDTLGNKQASSSAIRIAIKLCGILKDQDCAPVLENFLLDKRPLIRGAALLALTRISPGKFNEKVFEFLNDEAPAVSNAAVAAYIEGGLQMTPNEWVACVYATQTTGHFQRLVALSRKTDKWEHIGALLEYSGQGKFPDQTASHLNIWRNQFNCSFVQPSQQQLDWIKRNLSKYVGKSPSAGEIAFYLP